MLLGERLYFRKILRCPGRLSQLFQALWPMRLRLVGASAKARRRRKPKKERQDEVGSVEDGEKKIGKRMKGCV